MGLRFLLAFFSNIPFKILPVFLCVFCDNLLLTVVVPILPELLRNKSDTSNSNETNTSAEEAAEEKSCFKEIFHLRLLQENTQLGLLYSTKAFVQLIANPIVGKLTLKIGYKIPLCLGNFILLLCSLVFGFADSIPLFTIGRSCHGVASSLIAISGMALVAEEYQGDEQRRTSLLGRVMGAAALGVLAGYPFGGISYAFFGKSVPFLCVGALVTVNLVVQLARMAMDIRKVRFANEEDMSTATGLDTVMQSSNVPDLLTTSLFTLLHNRSILIVAVAIWLTTTAMQWQMGLIFVPDSLGYCFGTNFLGQFALRVGRWKTSMFSMSILGISCFLIPLATNIWQLMIPHFALGLGLGTVDASLMPLLACLADKNYHAGYGVVYALAQTSVSLAYSIGPFLGGELVPIIGFPDLMRTIGFLNLLFCPALFLLARSETTQNEQLLSNPNLESEHYSTFSQRILQKLPDSMCPEYTRFEDEDMESDTE